MLTIIAVLIIIAFGCAIASLAGKLPVTVPVLLLSIVELIRVLPLGR